ncbi:hypothetical protein INS49_012026 [Diaporthe citri]|uniref:uncharacterized protein n=1 Tax=Diaporthe citri TaxID=83186 RepID=UPI001C7E9381|nr:uncharacterized protein INS49_012026 [Diaporthe citri]KAG6360958.1 hypothetical protein INS49_012026 [Diaporthe citri]
MGESSQQTIPTVIDLVTSSDDETCDNEHSENESLDDKSSDDISSDNDSPDDSSSDSDSSDDGGAEEEPQGNTLADGLGPSQDGSNKKANQTSASSDDDGRGAAHSITISMAKASIQNDGIKISPFDSSKKRKAPEHAAEGVHNDRAAPTATHNQANKRAKYSQPGEPQTSLQNRTCAIATLQTHTLTIISWVRRATFRSSECVSMEEPRLLIRRRPLDVDSTLYRPTTA